MTAFVRDELSVRYLLDSLRKVAPFPNGVVISTVPRGGLQVVQPSHVPEALLRSYARGFEAEDRLTWQAIARQRGVQPADVWTPPELDATPYAIELLTPLNVKHVVVLPVAAPVIEGYPGAVHLLRGAEEGEFTAAEVETLAAALRAYSEHLHAARSALDGCCAVTTPTLTARPSHYLSIVNNQLRPQLGAAGGWTEVDPHVRDQMIEQATRRIQQLNGQSPTIDRVQFPDSRGDVWTFRVVTHRRFPALGEGEFCLFCLQPGCREWSGVKPADFQADGEVSRLIPALQFMQEEYHRGPSLEEISNTVNLSPFHFHRRFSELLGLTPKQFMLECQIHMAKTGLLAGDRGLVQIAKDCGFAHQSHFTSRFKQATGMTPTRWRRVAISSRETSDN